MRHQTKMKYWCFNHQDGWSRREYPAIESFDYIEDFLEPLGFLPKPDYVCGDEFIFVSFYEHPTEDKYLFHVCLNNYNKILFSFDTPSALKLLADLNKLLQC